MLIYRIAHVRLQPKFDTGRKMSSIKCRDIYIFVVRPDAFLRTTVEMYRDKYFVMLLAVSLYGMEDKIYKTTIILFDFVPCDCASFFYKVGVMAIFENTLVSLHMYFDVWCNPMSFHLIISVMMPLYMLTFMGIIQDVLKICIYICRVALVSL